MKTVGHSPNIQHGMTYVSQAEDGFIDKDAFTGCERTTSQTSVTSSRDGRPLDSRLSAVINRWEAQGTPGDGDSDSGIEYVEMASLSDCFSRLPAMTDSEMWRVRVHVSPCYCNATPGTEMSSEGRSRRGKLLGHAQSVDGTSPTRRIPVIATKRSQVDRCRIYLSQECR